MKIKTITAALAASLLALQAAAEEAPAEQDGQGDAPPRQDAEKTVQPAPSFTTLPFCRLVEPPVEVKTPKGDWAPAEEGRFYPLGTAYRSHQGGKLILSFGQTSTATIEGEASFATRIQALGGASRTIDLVYGKMVLNLADNLPEGAFFVAAPGFLVRNLAGESRYSYETTPNGDRATVRCVTGSFGLSGRHFDIASMRAADEVVITSEHDYLVTMLEGTSGDYVVKIDQGVRAGMEVDDAGAMKEVVSKDSLDWHLSPKTKVVINRSVSSIGGRMSVHTMAFDAVGELQSDRIFCEGRAEINSGELVVKAASGDDLAKRAAEASETTEEAAAEDAPAQEEGDSSGSSSSDSSSSEE
jgi:hypothetical protein